MGSCSEQGSCRAGAGGLQEKVELRRLGGRRPGPAWYGTGVVRSDGLGSGGEWDTEQGANGPGMEG